MCIRTYNQATKQYIYMTSGVSYEVPNGRPSLFLCLFGFSGFKLCCPLPLMSTVERALLLAMGRYPYRPGVSVALMSPRVVMGVSDETGGSTPVGSGFKLCCPFLCSVTFVHTLACPLVSTANQFVYYRIHQWIHVFIS